MRIIYPPAEYQEKNLHQVFPTGVLSQESLDALRRDAQYYEYDEEETIFLDGSECLGVYLVLSGKVKLFKASQHGRELVVRIIGPGRIFNEVGALDGGSNPLNALAITQVVIMVIPPQSLELCLHHEPAFAQSLLRELCQNMRTLMGLIEELSFYQITNRLARLLIRLPADQLCGNTKQRMTQEDLAHHLGTVREVVARSLRELEKSGAIQVSRTGICIADRQVLSVWAQVSEN